MKVLTPAGEFPLEDVVLVAATFALPALAGARERTTAGGRNRG